jgi:hypothetical protein
MLCSLKDERRSDKCELIAPVHEPSRHQDREVLVAETVRMSTSVAFGSLQTSTSRKSLAICSCYGVSSHEAAICAH